MKILDQAGDLKGKRVFLRVDFDVPVGNDGAVIEEFRIVRQKATIDYLLAAGASVTMGAHISSVPSFAPLVPQLEKLLGHPITFGAGDGNLVLLENLRSNPGEEANDAEYAKSLVAGCDVYVNNAFAVCHRKHASVAAAAKLLPSYAGLLISEETEHLRRAITAPAGGKVVFMGGAKANTKVPVIKALLEKASTIVVGGVVANDIIKERGVDVGTSKVDEDAHALLEGVNVHDQRLWVPDDFVIDGGAILDVGPNFSAQCAKLAADAAMIIWNGPMGRFEDDRYLAGTKAVAQAIATGKATSIIGGGDTVAALTKLGIPLEKFTFVSTGGGAMLAFLAGDQLPGLVALGYDNVHV